MPWYFFILRNKQVRQQDAYPANAGGKLQLRATPPPPFQGQHLRLIACLYQVYSKLLKLTVASNAGDVGLWKIAIRRRISGRSVLDNHVWSLFGLQFVTATQFRRKRPKLAYYCSLIALNSSCGLSAKSLTLNNVVRWYQCPARWPSEFLGFFTRFLRIKILLCAHLFCSQVWFSELSGHANFTIFKPWYHISCLKGYNHRIAIKNYRSVF